MIVYPCLGCCLPDLPIEELRCPRCGEENFIPLNRTLSAHESHPAPMNDKKNFRDTSTEQTGKPKAILTDRSPNQHEEIEPMWKSINFRNEEHADGTNFKVKWSEGAGDNNFRYQNINWKQKRQLQNCSNNPAIKKNAIQEIPSAYDQAFNAEDNDVCDSTSPNFSPTVGAHGEERQNQQPQSKLTNKSSVNVGVDELSHFKNEDGEIDFAGCNKCLRQFREGQLSIDGDPETYKCEKCLCSFAALWYLKRHLTVHSNERPFKCGQCGIAFKRKDNLDTHLLILHT